MPHSATVLWLAALVESCDDAIVGTDLDGTITSWNAAAERLYGYPAAEALGRSIALLVPPDRPDEWPALMERLRRGERVESFETVRQRKDGSRVEVSLTVSPVKDAAGAVLGSSTIARDVTECRRAAEEQREEGRRKDDFLAMLGHELRNPLAPIRNAAHVLRVAGPEDPQLQWATGVIDRQVQHLTRLVDDLLDMSRIARGKVQLRLGPVDVAAVVARAVETVRPLIDERRHRLTVEVPPEPVVVEGDLTRLAQVVANLLTNAVKYTAPGGHIGLTLTSQKAQAVLRVADDGAGIAPELLARVFDPFTQAERAEDRAQGSLGIGLAVVRSLVELHGGTAEAHSDGPGRGAAFTVRLPLAPGVYAADGAARGDEVHRPPVARRVLVVDDNQDTAESTALLVRLWGHEARVAYDGPAALALARDCRPEVVLLDIGLPGGMDGYEVARQLRAEPGLENAFLVAVTGYGQEGDRRLSWAARFDRHLVKPLEPVALEQLLASAAFPGRPGTESPAGVARPTAS